MTKADIKIKPHHFGVSVPDLEASIKWYHDMLGFDVAKKMSLEGQNAKIAFLKKDNFYVELFEIAGAEPLPESRRAPNTDIKTHGNKHLAYVVDDLGKVTAALRERGVDIAMDGSGRGQGPRATFIRDNAGNLIELVPPDAP